MYIFNFYLIIFFSLTKRSTGSVEIKKYHYIGCFENLEKSSLLISYEGRHEPGTNSHCVDICEDKKFSFAGIHKKECRCGNHIPSSILKRSHLECNFKCDGDSNERCGGHSKLSVYGTGVPISEYEFIPTRIYFGCYKDDNPEFRVLKGSADSFNDNTPAKCHKHCYKSGFKYFGLTYIKECFCGDTAPLRENTVDEGECNTRCNGDNDEICGGGWRLSLYSTGITDFPESGLYLGCYKNVDRSKNDEQLSLPNSNSNRRCLNVCNQKGFPLAGVKGSKCFCLHVTPSKQDMEDDYNCDVDKCPGDITEYCGSKNLMKIHRTRIGGPAPAKNIKYHGCFQDQLNFRIFDEMKVVFENNLTPELCNDMCKEKGYAFAGLQYRKECFCGHAYPSSELKVGSNECDMPCSGDPDSFCGGGLRLSVYETGIPHPQAMVSSWYMGCYRDDDKNNRMLKGSWQELANNSPNICHKLCTKNGYLYFGLTWIKECFCGDEYPSEELKLSENECQKECGGDSTKKCGGGWRLSVYKTGLLGLSVGDLYMGCFRNDGSLLADRKAMLTWSLSPKRCLDICDQLGFLYAGVERGIECRCGNQDVNLDPEQDSKCALKCPGDTPETCGRKNYIKIYRTTNIDDKGSDLGTKTRKCDAHTRTTKLGHKTCNKNDLIFEEQFSHLNRSTWKHTIKMANEPDFEFVTYCPESEVTKVKNGKLIVKPKIHSNNQLRGNQTLKGCTSTNSNECTRNGVGFNILPPISSAQISTVNSFWFRYGIVEIKAKLPTGDWIMPQLWLMPKYEQYGNQYKSGQIRIAMAAGNEDLDCENENLGNGNLQAGIFVGPPNQVNSKLFKKSSEGYWGSTFHIYKIEWTPDNILFYVDDELISKLLDNELDTVCSVTSTTNDMCIGKEGSNLAPFDEEVSIFEQLLCGIEPPNRIFYIVLGVSVGGFSDFPDDCKSHGKNKPWNNLNIKAMLHFWENLEEWKKTWINEKSELQVDYIKVYSL